MAVKRRSKEEVEKVVAEIDQLRAGGMGTEEAFKKTGLAGSVYWKAKKGQKSKGQRGSVRVDSLPPRPKKGGKRPPKPLNLRDVASVAMAISKIDRKLASVADLQKQRERLANVLMGLLK